MSYGVFYDAPHLHIIVDSFTCNLVSINSVSQSDTISGVLFALSLTVQKLTYRRFSQCVPLRGCSMGGEPHGLSPTN